MAANGSRRYFYAHFYAHFYALRDLLTPLCSGWRRERGCAVVGRGARLITLRLGVRGVQRLATWQPQVERLRRALGGRSSNLARSSRGLYHAFTTASRSAFHNRGSRGARLDVEVLRRPRWRWRPAHSDTASRSDRASSRVSTRLAKTHRTRVGSDSRRSGRRRAPAALASSAALLSARAPRSLAGSTALATLPAALRSAPPASAAPPAEERGASAVERSAPRRFSVATAVLRR